MTDTITLSQLAIAYQDLERQGSVADEFRVDSITEPTQEQKDEMLRRLGLEPECRLWAESAAQAVVMNHLVGQTAAVFGAAPTEQLVSHMIDVCATQLMNGIMIGRLVARREAGLMGEDPQ
jgi:hypothetical protein